MKKMKYLGILLFLLIGLFVQILPAAVKPTPDEALKLLVDGNKRFAEGTSLHPNTTWDRLQQAGTENQGIMHMQL